MRARSHSWQPAPSLAQPSPLAASSTAAALPRVDHCSAAELVPRCRCRVCRVSGIARQCRGCRALQCVARASLSMQHWSTNVALNTFKALGCATSKHITHAAYPMPCPVSSIAGARLGWLEPRAGHAPDAIDSTRVPCRGAFARARLGTPFACHNPTMLAPVIQVTHCPNSPNIAARVYDCPVTLRARRYL